VEYTRRKFLKSRVTLVRKYKLENFVVVRQELQDLLPLVNYSNKNRGNVSITSH